MARRTKGIRQNDKHKDQALPARFRPGFLVQLDGRTDLAKALKVNHDAIVADIGGMNEVGHVKRALVERFVWLEAILQNLEAEMVQGGSKVEIMSRWIQAVNSLAGLAKVLGIERRDRALPWAVLDAPAQNPSPFTGGAGATEVGK